MISRAEVESWQGLRLQADYSMVIASQQWQGMYIETFLAAARIGCPFVVLNNTYSSGELTTANAVTCKLPEPLTV